MRTQVAIIGAGPAGLLLGHLLHQAGVDTLILEARSRAYCEDRIRAGLLEQGSADVLTACGVGARMAAEGLPHDGVELRFDGQTHRIDLLGLTGRRVTIYGQQEIVRDLIAARLESGAPIVFEAAEVALHDLATDRPRVTWAGGEASCEIVAGCDGFHGVCRAAIPPGVLRVFEREYPFAWLGILAAAPPASDELIYARHAEGFALATMRSPSLARLYLQCAPDEDLTQWSDARIWDGLHRRLGRADGVRQVNEGPILQRGVTGMRSFVAEPMRWGRLCLAGDAAHIVPPTGAKGMNLAIADVTVLAEALEARFRGRGEALLDAYSATCLARVWKVQRFSWWMTTLLHRFDGDDPFEAKVQAAELAYVCSSAAAAMTLAENYVGLPLGR